MKRLKTNTYKTQVMNGGAKVSRYEKFILSMKDYGRKCRYFYQLTLKT